jgi:hypothetical protein
MSRHIGGLSVEKIILIIVAFLAVAYLFDMWRQGVAKRKASEIEEATESVAQQREPLTANEAMPTQTGRFRAKQVLEKASPSSNSKELDTTGVGEDSEEEEALPDPFER